MSVDGRVSIDTYKGSIEVTTWNRDEVQIDAVIEADEDTDLVALTDIVIRESGRGVTIETDYDRAKKAHKRGGFLGGSTMRLPFVHYTIRMPETADLSIEDYKSEIDVVGLTADVSVETYKGEVHLEEITGALFIETYKGEVSIEELDGALEAETYKGEINAHFTGIAGHNSIDTYRGDIRLMLPRDAGFELDANMGRHGDIDSDFKLSEMSRDGKRVRGVVNGGGARLDVETYRGNIDLRMNR